MNNTNTSSIYYYENNLEYELTFILCLFGVIIFIIVPCMATTDEYKDIAPFCRPLYCWMSSIYYSIVTVNDCIMTLYYKITDIKKKCGCCNKIEIPHANTVDNISQTNMPDSIIIIYNNSIIVNTPLDYSHASVITKQAVVIGEEIQSSMDTSPC